MTKPSITVRVPGTCGELVQGRLDNSNFLVTCPVNIYSDVTVALSDVNTAFGKNKWKAEDALKKVLRYFEKEELFDKVQVEIISQIPLEKGMASSTADIVGVCLATACLLNKSIGAKEVADIALSIEPSDGTMFDGITMIDHLKGNTIEHFGEAPELNILIIDKGGTVDTIEFNQKNYNNIYAANETKIRKSLELVKEGIKSNDISLIGRGATISALCHQEILYKPELEAVISQSRKNGALGVNVAHSGTVIGILLHPDFCEFEALKRNISPLFNSNTDFYVARLVSGGGVIVS